MNKMAADNIEIGDVVAPPHADAQAASHSIARMREEGGALAPIECERKRLISAIFTGHLPKRSTSVC